MVRASVVACSSLGALFGKDFIKSLKMVLDFDQDTMSSPLLGLRKVPLEELRAGHYKLPLVRNLVESWKLVKGQAIAWFGVCEVVGQPNGDQRGQKRAQTGQGAQDAAHTSSGRPGPKAVDGCGVAPMGKAGAPPGRKGSVALARAAAVALAAACLAPLAFPLAGDRDHRAVPPAAGCAEGRCGEFRHLGRTDGAPEQDGFRGRVPGERRGALEIVRMWPGALTRTRRAAREEQQQAAA